MLKAQLRSKIGVLGSEWRDIEDILTGDFFGALDYLPRDPFLKEFIEWCAFQNPNANSPPCEGVKWDDVAFSFWPRIAGKEESAEPDIVVISNRWVLVIEVKLDSGLGTNQPWREYCVGKEIAVEYGVPEDAVYYLLVTRYRLDVASTFAGTEGKKRQELLDRTSHLLWHQAVGLVERWLRRGMSDQSIRIEHQRLLSDLFAVMKRRRAIAFSGFAFTNVGDVLITTSRLFCPSRFLGFLGDSFQRRPIDAAKSRFFSWFRGFLVEIPSVRATQGKLLVRDSFRGFLQSFRLTDPPLGPFMPVSSFRGFLSGRPRCMATRVFSIK